jgi:hypothetical protein
MEKDNAEEGTRVKEENDEEVQRPIRILAQRIVLSNLLRFVPVIFVPRSVALYGQSYRSRSFLYEYYLHKLDGSLGGGSDCGML